MTVTGVAEVTISRGRVVWENGKLTTVKGSGKFIPRPCFGPPFDGVPERDAAFNPERFKVKRDPYDGPVIKLDGQ